MRLRPATVEDAAAVAALERETFGLDAWSVDLVRSELTGPERTALVAVDEDGLAGYVVALRSGDVVDLQRVAVHPRGRRRGLARALLSAAADRSAADRMLLEVSAANQAALALYAAEGFTEIARRRRYYRDGSDAVVMERRAASRMGP